MKKYSNGLAPNPNFPDPRNSYSQNAHLHDKVGDAHYVAFQGLTGETLPGVPATKDQMRANAQGDVFGGGALTDLQRQQLEMVRDFEAEYGEGALMEVLQLIRDDATEALQSRPGQQSIDSAPIAENYRKMWTGQG